MAYVSVTAGPMHWSGLRQMAGKLGLQLEESRGFLQRTFVFRGESDAVAEAHDALAKFEAARRVSNR